MPPFLVKNKPAPMIIIETGENHSRYHSICTLSHAPHAPTSAMHSRSSHGENYLPLRRWLSQLGRDKRPAASACFHHPQALCRIQILGRLRHSFCIRLGLFYSFLYFLSTLFSGHSGLVLCFSCIPVVFPGCSLDKRGRACYLFFHNKCDDDATQSSPFSESRRLV